MARLLLGEKPLYFSFAPVAEIAALSVVHSLWKDLNFASALSHYGSETREVFNVNDGHLHLVQFLQA